MAQVSRSNTIFQKLKYLSPIYNSNKIIGINKFYFQKAYYTLELTCSLGFYDQENYFNIYASLLKRSYPLTFPIFQYLLLTKTILHIFLNVTIKSGSDLQHKHTQHSVNIVDISADGAMQAALKGGKEEI